MVVLHDQGMNATDLRDRRPATRVIGPFAVVAHPRSSLVIRGLSLAVVGAALALAAGIGELAMMSLGLALFVVGSATAMSFAGPARLRDVRSSTQLGPDPEEVIGRHTGARI